MGNRGDVQRGPIVAIEYSLSLPALLFAKNNHLSLKVEALLEQEVIAVRQLLCRRDARLLFADLSFTLRAGQILQVEGPNGSGKTTLLRIISGLSSQYEGEIFFQGEPIKKARHQFHSALHYLGHLPGVKAALTPIENLRWSCGLSNPVSDKEILSALEQVGLFGFEESPSFALSAGQQRRVALARLYLTKSPLWILDEPFTAIDKTGVKALEQLIYAHAEAGGAVLLTTHHNLDLPGRLHNVRLDGVVA